MPILQLWQDCSMARKMHANETARVSLFVLSIRDEGASVDLLYAGPLGHCISSKTYA